MVAIDLNVAFNAGQPSAFPYGASRAHSDPSADWQ